MLKLVLGRRCVWVLGALLLRPGNTGLNAAHGASGVDMLIPLKHGDDDIRWGRGNVGDVIGESIGGEEMGLLREELMTMMLSWDVSILSWEDCSELSLLILDFE